MESARTVTDAEVDELATAMRGMALAMDQRTLCVKTLAGRSLSCSQAGTVLGAVKAGIAQRIMAREVLHGRILGLPEGLEDVLSAIPAELRSDVKAALLARAVGSPNTVRSITAPVRAKDLMLVPDKSVDLGRAEPSFPARQNDWSECVERLRTRVGEEEMSAALYGDLADTFHSLGLGTLPPPSARGSSVASSRAPVENGELLFTPAAPSVKVAPQAPPRPVPPAPEPGGGLPRSFKMSSLPAPPRQGAKEPPTQTAVGVNEGNLTVDDVADNMSEESV